MISFFIRKVNISASLSQFNLIKHYLVIKDDNNCNGQTYANKKINRSLYLEMELIKINLENKLGEYIERKKNLYIFFC